MQTFRSNVISVQLFFIHIFTSADFTGYCFLQSISLAYLLLMMLYSLLMMSYAFIAYMTSSTVNKTDCGYLPLLKNDTLFDCFILYYGEVLFHDMYMMFAWHFEIIHKKYRMCYYQDGACILESGLCNLL